MEHLDATAVLQLDYVETRKLVRCILLKIRRLNKFMFGELSGSIFGGLEFVNILKICGDVFWVSKSSAIIRLSPEDFLTCA